MGKHQRRRARSAQCGVAGAWREGHRSDAADRAAIERSIEQIVAAVQACVSGYRLKQRVQVDLTPADRPVYVPRLGYDGVHLNFQRRAEVALAKYGLNTVDILIEPGRRRMVGGQEDMIVDVALDLLQRQDVPGAAAVA